MWPLQVSARHALKDRVLGQWLRVIALSWSAFALFDDDHIFQLLRRLTEIWCSLAHRRSHQRRWHRTALMTSVPSGSRVSWEAHQWSHQRRRRRVTLMTSVSRQARLAVSRFDWRPCNLVLRQARVSWEADIWWLIAGG
ncbi:hypothetical protein DUNSADRAFT_12499 [Dunaliella salina]|uniref:Uncharacterized protein n=1 Tax=Dunaliella salina TaxID=3046 RepID=A0ABQ7GB92_DUNSA|nr:hypothetical protein DUNSADRAFT_12499 [Dunaliella salina]|eukprot:KAF5831875.1 hypothetical protein DUNSADRAFT_12499 [Dunaliella salina]